MRYLTTFVFPAHLDRLDYAWRVLATTLGLVVLAHFALVGYQTPMERLPKEVGFIVLLFYQVVFVLLPRVRAAGLSVWCLPLCMLPFVYLALMFFLAIRPSGHDADYPMRSVAEKT
jgi:hypothetical protein